MGSTKAFG